MSGRHKAYNTAKSAKGKAKEKLGKITDDPETETKGKVEQSTADMKKAAEKAKDAFKH